MKRIAWSTLSIFVALWLSAASAEELEAAPAGGNVFVVTNTDDSGPGSLREAITLANASGQPATIEFDIPGGGPYVIQPATLLPALAVPTLVDGLSQDGADCAAWPPTLKIEISGAGLTDLNAYGLALDPGSGGSEIRGLVVRDVNFNNNSDGLYVSSDANHVACNFIGTNVTGTVAAGNTTGIELRNANLNVIGTESGESGRHERNLVSGNDNVGIRVGRGDNNRISGNWIGTDVTGTGTLSGGTGLGISILSGNSGPVENTVIGYDGAGDPKLMRNVISGNRIGVSLGGHTRRTHVAGNYIGLNAQGTAAVANSDMGISSAGGHPDLQRLYNLIGWDGTPGQSVAQRNVISGNGQGGVYINYFNNMGNEGAVVGNWIGTDAQGDAAVPNGLYGLNLAGGVDPTRELVHANRIENNPVGIRLEGVSSPTQHPSFWNGVDIPELPNLDSTDNCITDNGAGVTRAGAGATVAVTFIENWWGAADGPGGSGGGGGDSIPGDLDYQPFLTEPPAHCDGIAAPAIQVSPAEVDFGVVNLGTSAGPENVTIHNLGEAAAENLTHSLSGSGFGLDGPWPCAGQLQPGESCQAGLTYTPGQYGISTGLLQILDSGEVQAEVLLSAVGGDCTAPDLTGVDSVALQSNASPPAGQGGELPAGRWELVETRYATSLPVTATGEAQGAIELDPDGPFAGWAQVAIHLNLTAPVTDEIELDGAGTYTAVGTVLNLDQSCGGENPIDGAEYTVTDLDPGFEMTIWTQFEYEIDGVPTPVTFDVEARFLLEEEGEEPLPGLDVAPASLDFGPVETGGSASAQTVTLTSTGTGPVEITAVTEATVPFSRTGGDCPATPFSLEPDQSCTLEYGFSPGSEAVFAETISITSDADPAITEVSLSGEGTAPPGDEIFDDRFEQ